MTTAATTVLDHASADRPARCVGLHRFAVALAVCTFGLILMGSLVTTTGSGLAVPDWPTTYGQNMFTYPPSKWVGGIFYEHVHRLIAATVGFLTIMLCIWLWRSPLSRQIKWLGTAALAAVCLQGLLGGLTVLFLLPTWISVAHAGLAEFYFCLVVSAAVLTSPGWRAARAGDNAGFRRLTAAVAACIYAQIILGAIVRHTDSGLAIPDFPLTYGSLLPPTTADSLEPLNEARIWSEPQLQPVTLGQIWIHFAHRLGAVVVAGAVATLASMVITRQGRRGDLVMLAWILCGLVALQFVLGAATVWSGRSLTMTTAHVGAGAATLACSVLLALRARCAPAGQTAHQPQTLLPEQPWCGQAN